MDNLALLNWIEEHYKQGTLWYLKRLSGNDTLQNNTHQAGPYIPKNVLFDVFPEINKPDQHNPDLKFDLFIDSHHDAREVRLVWYNNRLRGGTRNETRITGLGGASSALLDPDSTNALTIFVFYLQDKDAVGAKRQCRVWVCNNPVEEDFAESFFEPIEPAKTVTRTPGTDEYKSLIHAAYSCTLEKAGLATGPFDRFLSAGEMVKLAVRMRPLPGASPDLRLTERRNCEYEFFKQFEIKHYEPIFGSGVSSFDDFLTLAQTALQRRKARSGLSLELHFKAILEEEAFVEGVHFAYKKRTELKKEPDFIFPTLEAYQDDNFPVDRLFMLAVKVTCKDRWRQVLNEADRIPRKHLLTLQDNISADQFKEMREHRLVLVIPEPIRKEYPPALQAESISVESFLAELRLSYDKPPVPIPP